MHGSLRLGDVERVVAERQVAIELRHLNIVTGNGGGPGRNMLQMDLTEVFAIEVCAAFNVGKGDIVTWPVADQVALQIMR